MRPLTVIRSSTTPMIELPPTPAECTLLIGNEVGTPAISPRWSVAISPRTTEPTSVVVPPTSIIRTWDRQ